MEINQSINTYFKLLIWNVGVSWNASIGMQLIFSALFLFHVLLEINALRHWNDEDTCELMQKLVQKLRRIIPS